jgi:hypothetical protein
MEAKSQKTKRNSQYKSVAANLIWHISYWLAYGEGSCKIVNDECYNNNDKRDNYMKFVYSDKGKSESDYTIEIITILYDKMNIIREYIFYALLEFINKNKCLSFDIKSKAKECGKNTLDIDATKENLKRIGLEKNYLRHSC